MMSIIKISLALNFNLEVVKDNIDELKKSRDVIHIIHINYYYYMSDNEMRFEVIGCGAGQMSFTHRLLAQSQADIIFQLSCVTF